MSEEETKAYIVVFGDCIDEVGGGVAAVVSIRAGVYCSECVRLHEEPGESVVSVDCRHRQCP